MAASSLLDVTLLIGAEYHCPRRYFVTSDEMYPVYDNGAIRNTSIGMEGAAAGCVPKRCV